MAKGTWADKRESGTGQDTPKVCVPVPPRFPIRPAGHSGTLSRHVPLSHIGWLRGHPQPSVRWSLTVPTCSRSVLRQEAA